MSKYSWRDVFDSSKYYWGHIQYASKYACEAGYQYMCWNGRIYKIYLEDKWGMVDDTGYKVEDVQ